MAEVFDQPGKKSLESFWIDSLLDKNLEVFDQSWNLKTSKVLGKNQVFEPHCNRYEPYHLNRNFIYA